MSNLTADEVALGRELNVETSGTEAKKVVPAGLKQLAKKYFFAAQAAAKHKKEAEKERAALLKGMRDEGLKDFSFETKNDADEVVGLRAVIGARTTDSIDVAKLIAVVGVDKVLPLLSVGKGNAEDTFGKGVVAQCAFAVTGEENVTVSTVKG